MDARKEELKYLKKECRHGKREYYTHWKVTGIFLLIVAMLCACVTAMAELKDCQPVADMIAKISELIQSLETKLGIDLSGLNIWWSDGRLATLCKMVLGSALVLFVIAAVLWGRGKRRWKRSDGYLDFRTLKTTLKAERQAAKGR